MRKSKLKEENDFQKEWIKTLLTENLDLRAKLAIIRRASENDPNDPQISKIAP